MNFCHTCLFVLFLLHTSGISAQPWIPKDPFSEKPSWLFLENQGQVFKNNGAFADNVIAQSIGHPVIISAMHKSRVAVTVPLPDLPSNQNDSVYRWDILMTGPDSHEVTPVIMEESDQRYNFYEENTPNGITGVTGGKRVVYEGVYDNIDLHLYSNAYGPKMYIVVHPGGNPDDIRIGFEGHDSLRIDVQGHLRPYIGQRFIRLSEGFVYQQNGQNIDLVAWEASYNISNDSTYVDFNLDVYDPQLPLIFMIRPFDGALLGGGGAVNPPEWSTFMAGTGDDAMHDLTHDEDGNVYFTGFSSSGNTQLPITAGGFQDELLGMQDVIIGRFNEYYEIETPDTWMTYLGGNDIDKGMSITYDDVNDRLAIAGVLSSYNTVNFNYAGNPNSYSRTANFYSGFVAFFDKVNGWRDYLSRTPGQVVLETDIDIVTGGNGHTFVTGSGEPAP